MMENFEEMQIQNFDLNLFKVLIALFEERSVTRAAARLGRTQSAISNSGRVPGRGVGVLAAVGSCG